MHPVIVCCLFGLFGGYGLACVVLVWLCLVGGGLAFCLRKTCIVCWLVVWFGVGLCCDWFGCLQWFGFGDLVSSVVVLF